MAKSELPLSKSENKEQLGNQVWELWSCNHPRWTGNSKGLSVASQADDGDQLVPTFCGHCGAIVPLKQPLDRMCPEPEPNPGRPKDPKGVVGWSMVADAFPEWTVVTPWPPCPKCR